MTKPPSRGRLTRPVQQESPHSTEMDPVTQGALGAAATLAIWGDGKKLRPVVVGWLGALSAMAPDLDVLIRSSHDSLLAIEYHRHFTHSLAFVPIGATIALLPWLASRAVRANLRLAWLISFVGYFTHAPLDCATTYGTQFFWPFSNYRVSLSWISVVDPVFTLPLLAIVIVGARKVSRKLVAIGLFACLSYIGLGALQKVRVSHLQQQLIQARGHQATRRAVYGTFMNQVTWRSLYESSGVIYVDQIRTPYAGSSCLTEGSTLSPAGEATADAGPNVQRGYRLIHWFSSGWVTSSADDPTLLSDARYSLLPYGVRPFWGVQISQSTDTASWANTQIERSIRLSSMVDLIFRVPPGSKCGAEFPGDAGN